MTDPTLPYPDVSGMNTGGWSGSATSRSRAIHEVISGVGKHRKDGIQALVESAGRVGMTCPEVETLTGMHHGAASGALTNLHQAGRIARLKEQRRRSEVYIGLAFVEDRPTSPYVPNKANRRNDGYEDGYAAGWQDGFIAAREGMPPEPPKPAKTAGGEVVSWPDAEYDDDDEDLPPSMV